MKASSLKKVSRTELRHRILAALRQEPARSVTSLAQRLGDLRPSVSRSIKSLEDAGLITRQGRIITLSEAGQEELHRLDEGLTAQMKKNVDLATRILEQTTESLKYVDISPLSQFAEINSESPLLQTIDELARSPLLPIAEVLADSPMLQLGEQLANNHAFLAAGEAMHSVTAELTQTIEAINATANIQTLNLGLLKTWQQELVSPIDRFILDNNVLLGNMMVDLEATVSKLGEAFSQSLGCLVNQTAWTTKVFDTYYLDVIKDLQLVPSAETLELSLAIPTVGTASLVGSTRCLVEAHTLPDSTEDPESLYVVRTTAYREKYISLTPKLEVYLKPLGQHFLDKWEGAWQVFYSDSKDRHSQATHSARELIMQVLAYLAPDSVFTEEDYKRHKVAPPYKPTRKMRVKHILDSSHQSTVELIDCMANALDRMYDVVVGEAHRRDGNKDLDDTIMGQLEAVGALLIMLLSMHTNNTLRGE